MKSGISKYCCLTGIFLIAFTGMLMARDEAVFSASVSVDYASKFIWRGMNLNDDSVFQFNIEGGAKGFTGGIWLNMPLTDTYGTRSSGKIDEVDLSLDFSRRISGSKAGYSLGVIQYTFAGYAPATTEIYGGLNFDVPLSPSVTWYRDVDEIDGSYIQFGVGHTFEKIGRWSDDEYVSLDLKAGVGLGGSGYNGGYFGAEKTKLNDFTLNVAVPFRLKHGISIAPNFNVSAMLSKDIRNSYTYGTGKSTNVWVGVNFTKSF